MKSQINLLHSEFVPKFTWVCAQHFVGIIVLSTLLCAGGYGAANYMYQQKEQEVAGIQKLVTKQQQSIEEITNALTNRLSDPAMQNELNMLTAQSSSRDLLLNHIRNLSALKQRSFSALFDSLAQSSSSQLWLTHFLITPEELNLEGGISTPRALPLWISELSKTDFFAGQEFSVASVDRNDKGLTFTLNSVNSVNSDKENTLAQVGGNNER